MNLNYDYVASKKYCDIIGLQWLGDDFPALIAMDSEAKCLGFTQEQVDAGMRHHLWQVKNLFNPSNYTLKGRIMIAFHFLFGREPNNKSVS
jgi:hypothetical protein